VIFLTVGSHEPFDRLVRAVDDWCAQAKETEVFGQITNRGIYRPKHFCAVASLTDEKFRETCVQAEILIAHAGMGSIICALDSAKPIVIMPRRGHLLETRNDHQYATARRFRGKRGIYVADDERSLVCEVERARASLSIHDEIVNPPFAEARLIEFLSSQFRT
jgi:UDP-N-acetylglucosamine transferase subunit ALG13